MNPTAVQVNLQNFEKPHCYTRPGHPQYLIRRNEVPEKLSQVQDQRQTAFKVGTAMLCLFCAQKRIIFSASLRPLAPLPVGPLYPSLSIYPPPIFLAPTPSLSSVPLFAKSPFPELSHKVSPCLSLPWALLDCVARLCANHHDLLLHSPLARVAGHHQVIVQQNMIMMNSNIMNSNMINSNTSLQKVAARSAWPGVLLLRAALAAPQLLQVRSISTSEEFWIFRIDCM